MKNKIFTRFFKYLLIIACTVVIVFISACSQAPKAISKSKKGVEKIVKESLEQSNKKKDNVIDEMQKYLLENAHDVPGAIDLVYESINDTNEFAVKKERLKYPWELDDDILKKWREMKRQDSLFEKRLKEKRSSRINKLDSLLNSSN